MRITKPALHTCPTSCINALSQMYSPSAALTFSSIHSTDCHIASKPTIQPSDLGANSVFPSILSVLERMSIIRGKRTLLEINPAEMEAPIRMARKPTPSVEKPKNNSSPFKISAISDPIVMLFPKRSPPKSNPGPLDRCACDSIPRVSPQKIV